jgi:hypothetical protein
MTTPMLMYFMRRAPSALPAEGQRAP